MSKEIDDLNIWLKRFGTNLKGEPIFRIAFTPELTQVRYGEFNEFYGDIFVRTIKGFLERPKYDIGDRYILEQWFPPEMVYDPDIPCTKEGDYMCRYVFEDRNGNPNPLYVIPKITELLMREIMKPSKSAMLLKSIHKQKEEDKAEQTRKLDEDTIDTSPIQNALHMKEGIGYTKEIKDGTVY